MRVEKGFEKVTDQEPEAAGLRADIVVHKQGVTRDSRSLDNRIFDEKLNIDGVMDQAL